MMGYPQDKKVDYREWVDLKNENQELRELLRECRDKLKAVSTSKPVSLGKIIRKLDEQIEAELDGSDD
jgi:hypothetical protein